jgi:RNA polymerase sigma-70 factor (ECF subfamily)
MYLRLTGDLSFKEIGDILNRNETWARVTFYRGKQKLLSEESKMMTGAGCSIVRDLFPAI